MIFFQLCPALLAWAMASAARLHATETMDFYYSIRNSVYKTSAQELNLKALGPFIPLSLTLDNAMGLTGEPDKTIVVFSPLKNSIERIPLKTFLPNSLVQALNRNSSIIDQGKLYIASSAPQKLKDYSADTSNGILAVTPIPNHDRICMLSLPKDAFPGSDCIITDTKTGENLASFRLKDVYANTVGEITWISDNDVLGIIYSRRGNSCFLIDTRSKSSSWKEVGAAQYFSAAGNKLILYYKGNDGNLIPKEFKF